MTLRPFLLLVTTLLMLPPGAARAEQAPKHVSSGDVVLQDGERAGEVVSLSGNVVLGEGASAEKAVAIFGSVTLKPRAVVAGEVTAVGGDVTVADGARIDGQATAVGGKVTVAPTGHVAGQQTSVGFPCPRIHPFAPRAPWNHPAWSIGWSIAQVIAQFVTFFALGLLLLALFPARLEGVTASLARSPGQSLLVGLLATLALPLLTFFLVVTLIGIPLVPLEIIAVAAAGIFGLTALSLYIGRRLPIRPERGAVVVQLALGTAIVVIVTHLPWLGCLVALAGWSLAFGAVLRTRFGRPGSAPGAGAGGGAPPPPVSAGPA